MEPEEKQKKFTTKIKKNVMPRLQTFYIYLRDALKWLGEIIFKAISFVVGHLQQYKYGYLVLICIAFIIATFLFINNTTKITSQTLVIAESIKKIEELNNLNFQQSRQILLHVIFDMQTNENMQPTEFNNLPIFKGSVFNEYIQESRFNIYIKNESSFHFVGKIYFNIGLNYFEKVRGEWILKTVPYQISRNLSFAPADLKKFEITDDLLNSGALPNNLTSNETVKISIKTHFEEAFQPKVKITHRLSYL